jgi:hypothetical protein
MPAEPVKYIGDKLVVGPLDYSFLPAVPAIPGTTVLNGPVWIGAGGPPIPIANCMIGPGLLNPISLNVTGISNLLGIHNRAAIANVTGLTTKVGATVRAALSATTGVAVKSALNTGSSINIFTSVIVDKTCAASKFLGDITGTVGINPQIADGIAKAAASPPKGFDMHHPTKPGWRLTHICIEGPEAAVYYRGKLENSNIIELPDYWRGLVDAETITVQLTPIGSYQELYYEISDWGTKIKVLNNAGSTVNCSYVVFGERKDVDKIVVEYEGNIEDYPGKDQRSIVGYHYDYRPGVNG